MDAKPLALRLGLEDDHLRLHRSTGGEGVDVFAPARVIADLRPEPFTLRPASCARPNGPRTVRQNVDDMRESPSLKLIALIEARGGRIDYHDPFIGLATPPTREYPHFAGRRSVALSPRTIASCDAVLIATDHDGIDYAAIIDHAQIVIDTRKPAARAGLASPKIVKA